MISFGKTATIILFMSITASVSSCRFAYEDLQEIGASCAPQDSCRQGRSPEDDPPTSCSCDPMCSRYGSCCIDSPHLAFSEQKESCGIVHGTKTRVYMVSRCEPQWQRNTFIMARCEGDPKTLRDPLSLAPVTSPSSGVTYKNYFCAMCNNDYLESILWKIKFEVAQQYRTLTEEEEEELISRLEYNAQKDEWFYKDFSGESNDQDVPIKISFENPEEIEALLNKKCREDLISECAESWRYEQTRIKCQTYMAAIFVPPNDVHGSFRMFRNAHCAICNYIFDFSNSTCVRYDAVFTAYAYPGLTLSVLLDVNTSDGSEVGQKRRCREGRVYDPFYKKCRSLECGLPGFVLRNNSCARV